MSENYMCSFVCILCKIRWRWWEGPDKTGGEGLGPQQLTNRETDQPVFSSSSVSQQMQKKGGIYMYFF